MKKFDLHQSNNPKKQREKQKRHIKPLFLNNLLFAKNCWPKVLISRGYTFHAKTVDSSATSNFSHLEASPSKLQAKEEQIGCNSEHPCCNKNATNLEEEQSVCLISSSSEIGESLKLYEPVVKTEKRLTNIKYQKFDNDYDCSTEESAISETNIQDRPIFVDLTADEKKPRTQTILESCCDVIASTTKESQSQRKDYSAAAVSDHRIMIADSSSRMNSNESSSLATALRDRGPCLIPVQPNHSLPIRPAPAVPTRSFRKDCFPLFIFTKSSNLNVGGVESVTSNNRPEEEDINSAERIAPRNAVTSINYVVPQISSVESLSGIRNTDSNDVGIEEEDDIKGSRKKKRSQEADSSENKESLTNFCASNTATQMQNLRTDKCIRIISTSEEEKHNKVVPPLRLKKIVRTEAERHSKSQTITGMEHESNYRIITDATSQPPCNPSSSNENDTLHEKNTDMEFSNTDSYKLKYRRNRLKQKLQELRSKALELAEQMANDANSQQNTRLRQVMNRYEKQIENLSKLHSKLSAAFSVSKKLTDMNNKTTHPTDDEYSFVNLTDENGKVVNNNSPISSPEPPKLSPRSPLNYDNILPEDVRNSPPILPRICMSSSMKQDSVDEEVQITEKKVWTVGEESVKMTHSADSLQSNTETNIFSTPESPGNTSVGQQDVNVDIGNSDLSINNIPLSHSESITEFPENKCTVSEKNGETEGLGEEVPRCRLVVQKSEKNNGLEFSDPAPVRNPVTSSLEVPVTVQKNEMFEIPLGKQVDSSTELISQPGSYKPDLGEVSFTKVNEGSSNARKVTSSSGQSMQSDAENTVLNEENLISQQSYKGEKISSDFVQKSASHPMAEQFPTLGNWLSRMSNKQTLKPRSKLKTVGNSHIASTESASRIPGYEASKTSGPNAMNDIVNTTPLYNMERWQYHNHQEQRQQLLQHVASSVTLSQPATAAPTLRPAICPPIPMAQFCPNNYTIDPYNSAALTYHPAIYPYGTYPYHSRLHASTLPAYHFPMQDSLRPMQHMNKRFPLGQDPMIRYSSPSTSTLQHPSNLDFGRLRGNPVTNNVGSTTYLSSLLLPSPTLPPSHQTLPRAPLLGYPTSSQSSRNRMVPDVVAAAAAAAVVAAASFDRQRDTLTYNRADTDTLSTGGITNVINGQTPQVPGSNTLITAHRETSNQAQENNLNEEGYENTKYQQMQNILFDRLALVETADNFAQRNSVIANDTATPVASILSTTPHRMPLIPPSHAQLSKSASRNESRSCETPHLGKINRSPNSLHNFTCSNCGIVGPKFKCLGCELAFYCNERCQEEHWYVHVQKCPKKMPKLKKVS